MRSRARPFGQSALLVTTETVQGARALAAGARTASWPDLVDVVDALDSVVLVMRPGRPPADLDALSVAVDEWCEPTTRQPDPGGEGPAVLGEALHIACTWNGSDLDEVAMLSGLGPRGVVDALTSVELEVAFVGFSPGFPYLTGLPPELAAIPRRPTPRHTVPAGSVALAGGFGGVYPRPTPGGWQLVGRTDVPLFQPARPPFARLLAGQRVRFTTARPRRAAGPTEIVPAVRGASALPAAAHGPVPVAGVLRVEVAGALTTVQDAGRAGFAHLGVPRSGPADPEAHELANRLVGNAPGAAALEVTGVGPVLRGLADTYVAVVGGGAAPSLDGRSVPAGTLLPLAGGQVLDVGRLHGALRATVAVAGGLVLPGPGGEALGSVATDTLSGLGPPPLRSGDVLVVAGDPGTLRGWLDAGWEERSEVSQDAGGAIVLRVVEGPHAELFEPGSARQLAETVLAVDPASDRIGVRLVDRNTRPLRRRSGELHSHGMVTGAIQVPPDGTPIVLLPDHASHGGYPVVAVVIDADLPMLGRLVPGDAVRLRLVSRAEAHRAWTVRRRLLDGAVSGRYPVEAG